METYITKLKENQVFIFGSNLNGHHLGGAARQAYENFGAEWGNSIGIQGKSYAIPTLNSEMQKLPLISIKKSLQGLVQYANSKPNKEFFLTPIGTGIANFSLDEINSVLPPLPVNIIKVGWN